MTKYTKTSKRCYVQSFRLWWNYSKLHKIGMAWWSDKKRHVSHRVEVDQFMNDTLEDMILDIGVDTFKKIHVENTLQRDME